MSGTWESSQWRFLITPRWLGWHAFTIASVIAMLRLGDWQFHRALSGNSLSWAYTFEWPIFAIFVVYFWIKTIRDEFRPPGQAANPEEVQALPPGVLRTVLDSEELPVLDGEKPVSDEEYLARLSRAARGHGRWHGLR